MTVNSSKNSNRKWAARMLPTIAILIAAVSLIGAFPAAAAPHTVYTDANAGNARFATYGDHIYLCDTAEDDHSVAVYLEYTHDKGYPVEEWRWHWEGPYENNGCKDIVIPAREYSNVTYKVCLGNHGHPGGKEADVIDNSCSEEIFVYNDNSR